MFHEFRGPSWYLSDHAWASLELLTGTLRQRLSDNTPHSAISMFVRHGSILMIGIKLGLEHICTFSSLQRFTFSGLICVLKASLQTVPPLQWNTQIGHNSTMIRQANIVVKAISEYSKRLHRSGPRLLDEKKVNTTGCLTRLAETRVS